jgi:copper chaperone CopZ
MAELIYKVPAIHCAGCAATIGDALEPVEGVEATDVDVVAKTVRVRGSAEDRVVRKILEASGYPPA